MGIPVQNDQRKNRTSKIRDFLNRELKWLKWLILPESLFPKILFKYSSESQTGRYSKRTFHAPGHFKAMIKDDQGWLTNEKFWK